MGIVMAIIGWMLFCSLVTAVLFVMDKRAAAAGSQRITERRLLWWSLLGGWPGGLLASRTVRHKTQKTSFRILFGLAVVANICSVALLFWVTNYAP